MKKICIFLLILCCFSFVNVRAEENLIPNAKSGLLMEVSTGNIVFEKDIDLPVSVASMTKMMSQILILTAIENGKIGWSDIVKVSSNAAGFGGSQIYLQAGEEMSVKDIFKGISMASANDGTVAMAEYIAGSEAEFVKMMNEKAKSLGLTNTVFKNSTGLDEEGHYSSARDMAIIARDLLINHTEILEYSSVYEDYLRKDTPNKFWLVNTNKLVRFYEGADGLKTGHTDDAGYCMAVTANRQNMRLLAIVFGEETAAVRNQETTDLLDYGFNNYKIDIIKAKDSVLDSVSLEKANVAKTDIVLVNDITSLLKKNDDAKKYDFELKLNEFKYPVKKGDVVGKLYVLENGNKVMESDVTVNKDIDKLNIFKLFGKYLKSIVSGKF